MATKREGKHQRIEVTGEVLLDDRLQRWESELLRAAFARLASTNVPTDGEVSDVASE